MHNFFQLLKQVKNSVNMGTKFWCKRIII